MTSSTARLAELVRIADPAVWTPIAGMKAVTGIVRALYASSPLNEVTIQLRKATSVAGANAANLGTAKTGDYAAVVTALAEELGAFSSTVDFTHVSATITDEKSPNAYAAVLVFEPKQVTPATGAQYVNKA